MTTDEILKVILAMCPNATLDEDSEEQLVAHLGVKTGVPAEDYYGDPWDLPVEDLPEWKEPINKVEDL